jgi:hypothetical protein
MWTHALLAAALAQTPPSVEDHLKAHEVYAVTDGSSIYAFHQDHTFRLDPVGRSGRTIEGVWDRVDGGLLVTGQWSWMNGVSAQNDYREMLVAITPHPGDPTKVGMRDVEIQPAYFTIEKLGKVDAAVHKRRRSVVTP